MVAALSILCTFALSGCSISSSLRSITSSGTWNDTVEKLRNRSYAAKAFYRREHNFYGQGASKDFKAGFIAGYEAIADGKPGCTPAFPPKEYWSWEFQSSEGQSRMSAWFAGYPHGVQAAREDGMDRWSQLQSSPAGNFSDPCATGQCGPSFDPFNSGMPLGTIPNDNAYQILSVGDSFPGDGTTTSFSDQPGTFTQSFMQAPPLPVSPNLVEPSPSPFPVAK